ncbi:uncharacterized protein LOC144077366 [Stigmatopora argus]
MRKTSQQADQSGGQILTDIQALVEEPGDRPRERAVGTDARRLCLCPASAKKKVTHWTTRRKAWCSRPTPTRQPRTGATAGTTSPRASLTAGNGASDASGTAVLADCILLPA